jgi:uncharacterized protein YmfQ (DUF2313 family)
MKVKPGGKGHAPRPVLRRMLAELGKQILHEKDPREKARLIARWEKLKMQDDWNQARENNPHLWGEKEK